MVHCQGRAGNPLLCQHQGDLGDALQHVGGSRNFPRIVKSPDFAHHLTSSSSATPRSRYETMSTGSGYSTHCWISARPVSTSTWLSPSLKSWSSWAGGGGDGIPAEAVQDCVPEDELADISGQRHQDFEVVHPGGEPPPVPPLVPRDALQTRDVRLADRQVLQGEDGQCGDGPAGVVGDLLFHVLDKRSQVLELAVGVLFGSLEVCFKGLLLPGQGFDLLLGECCFLSSCVQRVLQSITGLGFEVVVKVYFGDHELFNVALEVLNHDPLGNVLLDEIVVPRHLSLCPLALESSLVRLQLLVLGTRGLDVSEERPVLLLKVEDCRTRGLELGFQSGNLCLGLLLLAGFRQLRVEFGTEGGVHDDEAKGRNDEEGGGGKGWEVSVNKIQDGESEGATILTRPHGGGASKTVRVAGVGRWRSMGESQAAAMAEGRNCLRHGQEGARRRQPGSRFLDSALSPRPSLFILVCSLPPPRHGLVQNTKRTVLHPRPLLHATDTSHNASRDAPKKTATDSSLDPEAPAKKLNEITTTMNNGRVGNLDGQAGVVGDRMLSNLGSMPLE